MKRAKYLTALLFAALVGALFLSWAIRPATANLGGRFAAEEIAVADYDLDDLGVVDANVDGYLDIFTTNHSSKQSLLLNNANQQFTDALIAKGLSQDYQFPALENSADEPVFDEPGLYIYRRNSLLHIRSYKAKRFAPFIGEITFSSEALIRSQDSAVVEIESETLASGAVRSKVMFTVKEDGWLTIENLVEIPHEIALDSDIDVENVYLGLRKVHPQQSAFKVMWRDRHTMAWADVNGDRTLDLFIGRGGVKGQLGQLPETFSDELMIAKSDEYVNQAEVEGLVKGDCPARQSAWVDFDKDDDLDLYVACGRGREDANHPNQLFRRSEDGAFVDVAKEVGLDLPRDGRFVWIDIDRDGDVDLFSSQDTNVSLYINQEDKFVERPIDYELADSVRSLSLADYDADEDIDIYIATKRENVFFKNEEDQYLPTDPDLLGLPKVGQEASWVDYDNDGLVDLHVVPSGLYRQTSDHQFEETQLLSVATQASTRNPLTRKWKSFKLWQSVSSWFDFDNDGDRDLIVSKRADPSLQARVFRRLLKNEAGSALKSDSTSNLIWSTALYRNLNVGNNWLEIDLVGSTGNAQAIGAEVRVVAATGSQFQQVGASEGSHLSQGHYRLYFGLGRAEQADSVQVKWPDGQIQLASDIAVNQLVTISKSNL